MSVRAVPFRQMPEWIAAGDVGLIFSRPSWANRARCPTKLAEFLASGVPVVVSPGIGDTDAIVLRERVGIVVKEFTEPSYEIALAAIRDLLGDRELRARCRWVAERHFALHEGVRRYRRVYQELAGAGPAGDRSTS